MPHVHGATYFARLHEVVGGDGGRATGSCSPTGAATPTSGCRRRPDRRRLLARRSPRGRRGPRPAVALAPAAGSTARRTSTSGRDDQRERRRGAARRAGAPRRLPPPEAVRRTPPPDRPEDDVAFVGGIDLCHSRRDDAATPGTRRPAAGPALRRRPPWHDAMARDPRPCRGPRPRHLRRTLGRPAPRSTTATPTGPSCTGCVRMPRHPKPLPERWDPPPRAGRHQVQLLRTYPPSGPLPLRPRRRADDRPGLCARLPEGPAPDLHRGPVLLVRRRRPRPR